MKQALYDIYDEHDSPLHKTASYKDIHEKGLWHRGVHIIIYTPDMEIVMQKRAPSLKYHPDEIEVSVGGFVDAGETPEQAAAREIEEELGLTVGQDDLNYVGKTKFNHRTKTLINKTFIYSYSLCLPKGKLILHINQEETSAAFFISERKLRRALKLHRIKSVGRISPRYAYWRYLLDSIN